MSTVNDMQKVVRGFDTLLTTASVGGSGTFAMDTVGEGFPEGLVLAGPDKVKAVFAEVKTPFGPVPWAKVLNVNGYPALRIPYHGWRLPVTTYAATAAVFWLLHELGVTQAFADASVGGIRAKARDLVIPHDHITNDYAKVEMAKMAAQLGQDPWRRQHKPFCERLGDMLAESASRLDDEQFYQMGSLVRGGTYMCTCLGPFETAADIRSLWTYPEAVVVGQSSGQEAFAARYFDICWAVINPVSNYAEGLGEATWMPGETMSQFYRNCAVPMGAIVWWTLEQMVANPTRNCECHGIYASASLADLTHPKYGVS